MIEKAKSVLGLCQETVCEQLKGGSKSVAFCMGEYVVRFPSSSEVLENQKREALVLEICQNHLPQALREKIPQTTVFEEAECAFSYHKIIYGESLEIQAYRQLNEDRKYSLAQNLAEIFLALHNIPVPVLKSVEKEYVSQADDWNFFNQEDFEEDKISELLLNYDIDFKAYKTSFTKDLVICHNDLSGSNILMKDNTFAGIIDFGNVGIMPRSNDFVPLYKVSRELAIRVLEAYNTVSQNKVSQKEVDLKALSFMGYVLLKNTTSFFAELLLNNFKN